MNELKLRLPVVGEKTIVEKVNGQTDFFCCPVVKMKKRFYLAMDARDEIGFHEGQKVLVDPQRLEELDEGDLELLLF